MQDCGKYTGGGDSLRALYDLVFFTPGASFFGHICSLSKKKIGGGNHFFKLMFII